MNRLSLISNLPTRIPSVSKWLIVFVFFAVWFSGYSLVNQIVSSSARLTQLKSPSEFAPAIVMPITTVVYVVGGFALPLMPFCFMSTRKEVTHALTTYGIASVIAFGCYIVWPLSIVRPEIRGFGIGEWMLERVYKNDLPGNCFPSSHVFLAFLGAMLTTRCAVGRAIFVLGWVGAILVSLSTITTGQHYWIDVAGGIAVAILSVFLAHHLLDSPQFHGRDMEKVEL